MRNISEAIFTELIEFISEHTPDKPAIRFQRKTKPRCPEGFLEECLCGHGIPFRMERVVCPTPGRVRQTDSDSIPQIKSFDHGDRTPQPESKIR